MLVQTSLAEPAGTKDTTQKYKSAEDPLQRRMKLVSEELPMHDKLTDALKQICFHLANHSSIGHISPDGPAA